MSDETLPDVSHQSVLPAPVHPRSYPSSGLFFPPIGLLSVDVTAYEQCKL